MREWKLEKKASMTDEQHHSPDDVAAATPVPAPAQGDGRAPSLVVNHRNPWDSLVAKVRDHTPAWVVNSASQFNLGLKGAADLMSIWSAVRKGSASPPRLIASGITLFSEGCGLFFKEKAPSDAKEREYQSMSLPQYAVAKTVEGFNPKDHILETNGLATILNGIFTTASGIRQSSKGHISMETWQGALTSLAGAFMVYMPERQRAWQISHTIFLSRLPFAASQSYTAYFHGYPDASPPVAKGDWQQAAKLVLNQSSNVFAWFYGGVKKMDDGRIVLLGKDSTEELPEKMRMRDKRHGANAPAADVPVTTVSHRGMAERMQQGQAMPEVAV